ncbi:MAG: hypothetical protein QNJ40_17145 [Xanthomonadales bacterium]|nr:hypothetical protein [Xanthomonadales bacterium]
MIVQEIRKIAKGLGVKSGRLKKAELIRAIQRAEGNFDCFGTAHLGVCDQDSCVWRKDCFTEARKLGVEPTSQDQHH